MGKLKEINGSYYESDYEYALIELLRKEGWTYVFGNNVKREHKTDVLIENDLLSFLRITNKDLTDDEISSIANSIKVIGGTTDFATLHKFYKLSIDGLNRF